MKGITPDDKAAFFFARTRTFILVKQNFIHFPTFFHKKNDEYSFVKFMELISFTDCF